MFSSYNFEVKLTIARMTRPRRNSVSEKFHMLFSRKIKIALGEKELLSECHKALVTGPGNTFTNLKEQADRTGAKPAYHPDLQPRKEINISGVIKLH